MDRVHELQLHVIAPPGREAMARRGAEQFVQAVLEQVSLILEARAPGRVVRVKHLSIDARIGEGSLADPDQIARCAGAIAEELASVPVEADASPPAATAERVAFASEAQYRASHLLAAVRGGGSAWCYAGLESSGDPIAALVEPGTAVAAAEVLRELERSGALVEVLAALPERSLTALLQAVQRAGLASGRAGAAAQPAGRAAARLSPPARALVAFVAGGASAEGRVASGGGATLPTPVREEPPAPGALPADRASRNASAAPPPDDAVSTDYGGLFYLLNPCLELDVGEILWKACLPEGAILGRAARLLLGPEAAADPAPAWFGGADPGAPESQVAVLQHAEAAEDLFKAFVAGVPRRGLARFPEPLLAFAEPRSGRLLIASAAGSAFPFFAWPVASPEEAAHALAVFLAHWPVGAPRPRALPAIAEFDGSGRVQPAAPDTASRAPCIAAASAAPLTALETQVAGTLAALVELRLGGSPFAAATEFARSHLAVRARLDAGEGTLTIAMALDAIDIALRRTGFDRDPGFVAWLQRTVRFVFEDPRGGDGA